MTQAQVNMAANKDTASVLPKGQDKLGEVHTDAKDIAKLGEVHTVIEGIARLGGVSRTSTATAKIAAHPKQLATIHTAGEATRSHTAQPTSHVKLSKLRPATDIREQKH